LQWDGCHLPSGSLHFGSGEACFELLPPLLDGLIPGGLAKGCKGKRIIK
jgi:hypothetical protein